MQKETSSMQLECTEYYQGEQRPAFDGPMSNRRMKYQQQDTHLLARLSYQNHHCVYRVLAWSLEVEDPIHFYFIGSMFIIISKLLLLLLVTAFNKRHLVHLISSTKRKLITNMAWVVPVRPGNARKRMLRETANDSVSQFSYMQVPVHLQYTGAPSVSSTADLSPDSTGHYERHYQRLHQSNAWPTSHYRPQLLDEDLAPTQ